MIPAYDCGAYLATALESVLAQDPGPARMQIEVVDDHSAEDPSALVARVAGGRVAVFRQPRNVGHVANFNTCLMRARGHLVHLLHGDDAVRPGFYEALEPGFADPAVGAAFCRYIAMDERGHWMNISGLESPEAGPLRGWGPAIARGQRLQPPAMVVRRAVYERIGGFDDRIDRYGEDWEMWTRIAVGHDVWFEPEPLALYRIHSGSLSAVTQRTGDNMRDLRRVVDINSELFPADEAARIAHEALGSSARAALRRGRRLADAGHARGAAMQAREAVRMSPSPRVVAGAAVLGTHAVRALLRARR